MRTAKMICAALAVLLCLTGCALESSVPYEPTASHTDPPTTTVTVLRRRREETTAPAADVTDPDVTDAPDPEEEELDRRLNAIYDLKPVPIPEGGWTDETLLPLINIGGKTAELPFCLSELLYGYALTGEHAAYYTEYADKVFSHELDFYDVRCTVHNAFGDLVFPESTKPHDPALPDGIYDHELELDAEWGVVLDDGSTRFPVSINCVTIGSTYDELVSQIGLGKQDTGPDERTGRFFVHCSTERISIVFSGNDNAVDTILLHDRKE